MTDTDLCMRESFHQGNHDFVPGAITCITCPWKALATKWPLTDRAGISDVKHRAPGDEILHTVRSFFCQDMNQVLVIKVRPAFHGVGKVIGDGVCLVHHRIIPPFSHDCASAFPDNGPGDKNAGPVTGCLNGSPYPCTSTPYNQNMGSDDLLNLHYIQVTIRMSLMFW